MKVYDRAQSILAQWRKRVIGATCLRGDGESRLNLSMRMRGTSPRDVYSVSLTIDAGDKLVLARHCTCPAFADSGGFGSGKIHIARSWNTYEDDSQEFNDDGYDIDYDDFDDDGGAVYGASSYDEGGFSGSRYSGICKHIVAVALIFMAHPEIFQGYRPLAGTPRELRSYMQRVDNQMRQAETDRQLDMLKRLTYAKQYVADQQHGSRDRDFSRYLESASRGTAAPTEPVLPGSVTLIPTLTLGQRAWSLRLSIGHGKTTYTIKSIANLLADVRSEAYQSHGQKLTFVHRPDMFDGKSRQLLALLQRALESRQMGSSYSYYPSADAARDMALSNAETAELIDLWAQTGEINIAIEGASLKAQPVSIIEGRPPFDFTVERQQRGASEGAIIRCSTIIYTAITGRDCMFLLASTPATEGRPALFRSDTAIAVAEPILTMLCNGDPDGVFIESDDWVMFTRTMLPKLAKADIGMHLPQSLAVDRTQHCTIAFYLDRTYDRITCEVAAKYGQHSFQLIPDADGIHGSANPDSTNKASLIVRDRDTEQQAVELVRQLFPVLQPGKPAVLKENNEDGVLLLLTQGVAMLREIGEVYSTPAFDGLLTTSSTSVKVGLSIEGNLVEISPIADEVPANEVGSVLASYRQRRRYHRLRDGRFLDMDNVDVSELDRVAQDLDLSKRELNAGNITAPAYRAFLLDAEVDDANKSASFSDYVGDLKIIDPTRYDVPEPLRDMLRPYQKEGFQWMTTLCDKGFGGILADEMGLGKSLQTLTLLQYRAALADDAHKVSLIVCPASLVYNWAAECAKFTPGLKAVTIAGTKAERRAVLDMLKPAQDSSGKISEDLGEDSGVHSGEAAGKRMPAAPAVGAEIPDIVITSYDLLRRDIDDYEGCEFDVMVLDEAQYIKNHATKLAKAVKQVHSEHRFALTGTPIENRLSELWSIFDFLTPGLLGTYTKFRERYEQPILAPGDEQSVMVGKLRAIVGLFIKRRLKADVLTELPDKTETVVTVGLEGEQRKLYAAHEQRLKSIVDKTKDVDFNTGKLRILAELTKLREICCDPRLVYANAKDASAKIAAIEELVNNCIDAGKKVLIFSQFTSFLDLIGARLTAHGVGYYSITGQTAKRKRVELVDEFNADTTPVFLISLKAGNTGLNLVGASVVIHADPWWNEAAQNQATDRAHRIGQTQDVTVYRIVAKDTIEERIVRLQEAKSDLARQFTDFNDMGVDGAAGSVGALTREGLLDLLS